MEVEKTYLKTPEAAAEFSRPIFGTNSMEDEKTYLKTPEAVAEFISPLFGTNSMEDGKTYLKTPEAVEEFIRSLTMQCENVKEEKEITESEIMEMLLNLKTTEENERGKGNMNEEKEITESEINWMLWKLKSKRERDVFFRSSIYRGWMRKRDQRFYEDCAKIGLAQHNGQNGTNFELDKICCKGGYIGPGGVYYHLNFIAESSDGSNDEKKRCLFFAEVVGFEERVVSVCCILDPVAGMDSGCLYCGQKVHHPRGYSFYGCRPT